MNEYKRLATLPVTDFEEIESPEDGREHDANSPATDVLTDFLRARPLMIEQNTDLETAREMMKRAHVRLKLVIDRHEHFKGLISLLDLLSVRVMQAAERTGLRPAELTVADVMTPRARLHAIDIRQIEHATIGDLLLTMQSYGDQHVLVVDSARQRIRGIVSSSDIARILHVPVDIAERACSFAEIYAAVRA